MSNLPLQSAVNHNDDNDEQITPSTNKLSTLNSRITSPLIIKRQQNIETETANNQAYDEIHDLQPRHSSIKKTNNDNSKQRYQSKSNSSHDLMQGNYYDPTRYDVISSSNHLSHPQSIHINIDEYKKTITPNSTSKANSNKTRSTSPPFGHTSESIQQGIAQSAGILLELNKKQHQQKSSMKTNYQSHDRTTLDSYLLNENETKKQRSVSASSSASDCSTSDSSSSNKRDDACEKSNIPYKTLTNDENEDNEVLSEQTEKPATESTFLNKNYSQTYGTQSISERSKYLPNNGYNSHGSSITTKSSSDNSGSIRTNSGSDNDEESDEEPFNNSSISNNSNSTSSKCINKPNDIRYSYSSGQNSYQSRRTNNSRSEQIGNNDEHHLQVPRFKQLPNDDIDKTWPRPSIMYLYYKLSENLVYIPHSDPSGNKTLSKLNSGTDHTTLPNTSTWPLQQSSVNQINSLSSSSSSHQNRNLVDRQEQQQYQSNSSRNNSRQHQIRTTKKRKQSQQQETIRTELIPGHRGNLDVDELVMFIDGNPSKRGQNSSSLNSTDANKPKLNTLNDSNSNKTAPRKKSRKTTKSLQQPISVTDDYENEISTSVTFNQSHSEANYVDNESNLTTHSIVDITNQSLEDRTVSTTNNNEYRSDITNITAVAMTNGVNSLPNWFEQTRDICSPNDDSNSLHLSSTMTNRSNSEPISEPFVTVTHRRRLLKERRQDNNSSSIRSSGLPLQPVAPSQFSSFSNNNSDKRRISCAKHNGTQRTAAQSNHSNNKSINTSTSIEENKNNNNIGNINAVLSEPASQQSPSLSSLTSNPVPESTSEKRQSSPRLSSQSSSSSLSSLIKRPSKPPPVVFLNKSAGVELNDVSFGFDLDSTSLNKSLDETNEKSSTDHIDAESTNASMPSTVGFNQFTDPGTEKSTRKFQPRFYRGLQFYSGSDIRPHHHRAYPSQQLPSQPSYVDPLVLLNYNQQRLPSYTHPLTCMNLMRGSYVLPQSQYVYLPTTLTNSSTVPTTATNETNGDEEANQTSSESIPEPLVVIAAPPASMYYHTLMNKKLYIDSDQQQTPQATPISSIYPAVPPVYPANYFYPTHAPHLLPSHPAYFQPITSPSLLIDTKFEPNDIDGIEVNDDDYEKSTKLYSQARQQSSSDIMSNALQLVYSQQRRNAQTDRFNLDDLTAYLAMKWTETVDHYEQGDNRILLVDE
ncbi:unnamed protein product [Adineta ricciae]|uniref:Uncharacterized protein n=1 Tax=Adineta ricciae TaxID=249248 RepID=A0A814YZW4_ADIRI|nr:unnamed protein product [Adineta ricciae]